MGNIGFRTDVDDKGIPKRIKRQIERGIDKSADEIQDELRKHAKAKVVRENAVWRGELLNGFVGAKVTFGDSTIAGLSNTAYHAAAQEHGVSGTQRKRDTPYSYTDKKPPLSALIPWVRDNLAGTGFWPDDLPGDGPGDDPGYIPDDDSQAHNLPKSDSGGSDKRREKDVSHDHDKLMGADELEPGQQDVMFKFQSNFPTGEVVLKFDDRSYDYIIRNENGDYEINAEDIVNWPQRGVQESPELVKEGEVVYTDSGSFGVITSVYKNTDTGETAGAYVDFDNDGQYDDLLTLDQFEIATVNPFEDDEKVPDWSPDHNPLMGADRLGIGDDVVIDHPDYPIVEGTITLVASDLDDEKPWDYSVGIEGGNVGVKFSQIHQFDGKGADPDHIQEGLVVYVGDRDQFGEISEVLVDPNSGEKIGAQVVFSDSDTVGESLAFDEFEIAIKNPELGDQILTNSNGLYHPDVGYRTYDITEQWDPRDTFPRQRVVVFDSDTKTHERGEVVSYTLDQDDRIVVELDNGAKATIEDHNAGVIRLAGGERWADLSTTDKKDRLATHFDEFISKQSSQWLKDNSAIASANDLTDPKPGAVEGGKKFWTGEIFDRYKDDEIVKEQVRNFEAIVSYEDSKLQGHPSLGGSIAGGDGTPKFAGIFIGDNQYKTISNYDKSDESYILSHEQKHALTSVLRLERFGGREKVDRDVMVEYADWTRSGGQNVIRKGLPSSAKNLWFRDQSAGSKIPILGGDGWIGDAFDAAKNGKSGIRNYSPTFETGTDEPLKRLHEASNHAWWLQQVAAREKYKNTGNVDFEHSLYLRSRYSTQNPAETLATFEEIMWGKHDEWSKRLGYIDDLYPWLIEAWLAGHNPPADVRQELIDLGYSV